VALLTRDAIDPDAFYTLALIVVLLTALAIYVWQNRKK
jgi:hypothetical protein